MVVSQYMSKYCSWASVAESQCMGQLGRCKTTYMLQEYPRSVTVTVFLFPKYITAAPQLHLLHHRARLVRHLHTLHCNVLACGRGRRGSTKVGAQSQVLPLHIQAGTPSFAPTRLTATCLPAGV